MEIFVSEAHKKKHCKIILMKFKFRYKKINSLVYSVNLESILKLFKTHVTFFNRQNLSGQAQNYDEYLKTSIKLVIKSIYLLC